MNIGAIIKDLREEKEFSMKELAEKVEVDIKSIWNWEHGIKEPKAYNIVKLADLFGVTTDYLLGRET